MSRWAIALAILLVLAGCQERLTVPGECPGNCPGGVLVLRDTVLEAITGADSSFRGYVGFHDVPGLPLANGTAAGTSHAVVAFEARPATFPFGGQEVEYTVDSVVISLGVISRDTLVRRPRLVLYRFPVDIDSTATFGQVEALFNARTAIDTFVVPDSVVLGTVSLVFKGEKLARLAIPPADSGRLAFGIRLEADTATGVRLGARLTQGFSPQVINFLTIDVPDTLFQKQFFAPAPTYTGFVRNTAPVTDPDLLPLGGLPAARAVVRFALPPEIEQAGSILRATLELTPARPHYGLAHDPTIMDVRVAVVDLGYRSIPISSGASGAVLPLSGEDPFRVEVGAIVNIWRSQPLVPRLFYLSLAPEGQAYAEPVFRSTRSATGRPRLRITYTVPAKLETP